MATTNTNIKFPQTRFVDPATGLLERAWWLWLQNPSFVSFTLSSAIGVDSGGTGQTTLTAHGVLVGEGTSAVASVNGTTGTYLKGVTGADPVFGAISGTDVTGAALTKTDDTNVTLSLGGTPTTALLRASSITAGWTGQLSVARGGTGLATLTAHALYVGNGTTAPTAISVGANGTVLHGNTGADPSFSAVSLTADVSGTLPVGNGGSGAGTFTAHGVLVGNGSGVFAVTSAGATNTVLHGNTGADPTYSAVVEADITLADNTTNNVATTKHGFAPKLPNDATKYLDGTGAYSVPSGSGITTFKSADQTITAAGSLTLAHGLSSTPTLMWVVLKCTSAELNYSVNDIVMIGNLADFSANAGVSIVPDATNLNIRYAVGGGAGNVVFNLPNKTTGSISQITNSKWVAIFRACVL